MKKALNAILEIGCEEIPARYVLNLLKELENKTKEQLSGFEISFSKIKALGTPRRLTIYLEGLPQKQKDIVKEVKGPPKNIAFDKQNKPTPQGRGFAKSQGADPKDIFFKKIGEKEYVFVKVFKRGKTIYKILEEIFPQVISQIYLPISMRWSDLDFKFIRPIHWIFAVCGKKILKFKVARIASGNKVAIHPLLSASGFKLVAVPLKTDMDLDRFQNFLKKYGIILDQDSRREKIVDEMKKLSKDVEIDKELLEEVNFLVENPKAILGEFDPSFLSLPKDVLVTSMKKNQKYFSIVKGGKLESKFIAIADGIANKYLSSLKKGYERVLIARLKDAQFFFQEDKSVPLEERVESLRRIEFLKNLGSLYDKTERLVKTVHYIGKHLGVEDRELKKGERIAFLSKADRNTQMVFEFPSLEGIMGREYALASKESPEIAKGIFEHHLPRFAGDLLPETVLGAITAISDKIDTLVGSFSLGNIPTGSEDPFGLRRSAYGLIKIVLDKNFDLLLDEIISHSYKLYNPLFSKIKKEVLPLDKLMTSFRNFISSRLKNILIEEGIKYDTADAALGDFNDILDAYNKAKILELHRSKEYFKKIVYTADRIKRLAKEGVRDQIFEHDLVEEEEKQLYKLYLLVNWEVNEAIKEENFEKALPLLDRFSDPVEIFFQKVLVMHKDERLKLNRLALLKGIDSVFNLVADFPKIVI